MAYYFFLLLSFPHSKPEKVFHGILAPAYTKKHTGQVHEKPDSQERTADPFPKAKKKQLYTRKNF